jgi:hypothetical protein
MQEAARLTRLIHSKNTAVTQDSLASQSTVRSTESELITGERSPALAVYNTLTQRSTQ